MKRVLRFDKRGKLSPQYVGPYEIMEKIGPVAYLLILSMEMQDIDGVFHVSSLKKCSGER